MLLFAVLLALAAGDDNPALAPADAKPGKVYQWKAADGLPYEFRVPEGYDPKRGANLTLVLHGNGLDHRWTFWNQPADKFRTDDIVVSPDGTSPFQSSNEFLGESKDAARLHALLGELKATWNVRQTFLYGHSQGSFFVFYYAGEYPDDVDGVCGHASGAWNWTKLSKKAHRQAIGVMHGTDDHIPYGQGWYAANWYREEGYPLVHLRTLFDWDHRPHWMQAQSVLAWCEGVTSDDPARVAASLELLADPKLPMGCDWSALWAVADRLAGMAGADDEQKKRK
jgi:predicted esterase